jgi:cell division protease FtsH
VAPFAALLADLATALRRGACCLVTADKGWANLLLDDLRERLRAAGLRCESIDARPGPSESGPEEAGVMRTALGQLRRAVRGPVEGLVIALPHLDVMATAEAGWTDVAREVVPLLYEAPQAVFVGFRDPTLRLLPVVEKLFLHRFEVGQPFGGDGGGGPAAERRGNTDLGA